MSKHDSNHNTELTTAELVTLLNRFAPQFKAIICCRRAGSTDLLQTLCKEVNVLIISVKRLLTKRKRKSNWYNDQLTEVHPHYTIDSNFVETIIHYRQNLKKITLKTRSKTGKKKSKNKLGSIRSKKSGSKK